MMAAEVFEENSDCGKPRFTSISSVLVTHIYGIGLFYGQVIDNPQKQDDMITVDKGLSEMQRVPLTRRPPQLDKVYAATFSEDGCVYRCKVI